MRWSRSYPALVSPILMFRTLLGLFVVTAGSSVSGQDTGDALQQQIQRYEQVVLGLDGNYDANSAEILQSLAMAKTQLGDYAGAADAYEQALQALRINQGLASAQQLTLLERHNTVLFQLQDWERLDTHYHLARDMALRLYGLEDPRTVALSTQLASWKIRAWQTGVYRPGGDRSVQEATEIYRQLLASLDPDDPDTASQRATWHSARGLAYFYSARHVASIPVHEFQHSAPPSASFQQCVPLVMAVDGAQPSANACQANQIMDPEYFAAQQREKNNIVRRHLSNMRQSFQLAIEALDADPRATRRQHAEAILNLGDANLLAEDYGRARSQYAKAWELLSQDPEDQALRDSLMGQPMRALQGILEQLPFDQPIAGTEPRGSVAFDVTEIGELKNISVGGDEVALTRENVGEIAIKLDQSVYRPKLVDGRPVRSRLTLPAADL